MQKLRFMHDPSGAPIDAGDDDEPKPAFDEQRHDVPNENGFVDGNDASMERPTRRRQGRRNALFWRRAPDRTARVELTSADGNTRGTRPADLERHGMSAYVAKDAQSVTTHAVGANCFRYENWMVPHRASLRSHAQPVLHRPRQSIAGRNSASRALHFSVGQCDASGWTPMDMQKMRFERSICAGRRQ
jgi:hypothetical protein